MSAEFESGFFVREPAWHRQGNVMNEAPSIEEGLKMSGLDWEVVKAPMTMKDITGEDIPVDGYNALVRDYDRTVLGVVGTNYNVLQNKDAFNWFDFLIDNGSGALESGGSLRNGKSIWVLAKMNQESEITDGDKVRQYLLLSNTHDGSMSVWIQFTPIRVVCWNTLTASLATRFQDEANKQAIRIRHTSGMQDKMNVAKEICDLSKQQFDKDTVAYKEMLARECTSARFLGYTNLVFEREDAKTMRAWDTLANKFENGIGTEIPGVQGTMWAAYNAITDYVDYERGRDASRVNAMWFGEGQKLKQRAFKYALAS